MNASLILTPEDVKSVPAVHRRSIVGNLQVERNIAPRSLIIILLTLYHHAYARLSGNVSQEDTASFQRGLVSALTFRPLGEQLPHVGKRWKNGASDESNDVKIWVARQKLRKQIRSSTQIDCTRLV
jgi:hypothetical protein